MVKEKAQGKEPTAQVMNRLVAVLKPLSEEGRGRAIQAAMSLLGGTVMAAVGHQGGGAGGVAGLPGLGGGGIRPPAQGEQGYFSTKDPKNKMEELAVSARYREEYANATSSTKAELETVFGKARKTFDSKHFRRDMENARRAGFFTREGKRDTFTLHDYGQRYVDALPDRENAKGFIRPGRRRGARRKAGRKPGA